MKPSRLVLLGLSLSLTLPLVLAADEKAAPAARAEKAQADGAAWLLKQQQPDGSFAVHPKMAGEVGVSALAIAALAKSGHAQSPEVEKGVAFLLKNAHPDGSIWNDDGQGLYNYRTSVSIMALTAVDRVKYAEAIRKGQDFIAGLQRCEKNDGTQKTDPNYGGIGYGDDGPKNDLSNTQMALQALKESGYTNDEVFKRAAEFAAKCQNHASNPVAQEKDRKTGIGNDGSFFYGPQADKDVLDKAGLESGSDGKPHPKGYGSMTYAGLLTMVYARLTKEDPRVAAAWDWIRKHYTVAENPGLASAESPLAGKQGLYYYYLTFAKSMRAYGESEVTTADGAKHPWASDLLEAVLKAQKPEGMWVNADAERWMEGNPVLATSFALQVVGICREELGASR